MSAWAQHMRFPLSCMLAVCCAAAVAGCGSANSGPDVLTAPIRVVRTADGTVAYRELGPAEVVAQMFPTDQAAAASAYLNDSLQYPGSYQVSAATFHSQYLAAERWLAGQDAVGHLVRDIRVPTLVAGGTLDQDIRPPNARLLASSVPGAKLLLFDDAGHAFLFQDAAGFIPAIDTFTR